LGGSVRRFWRTRRY